MSQSPESNSPGGNRWLDIIKRPSTLIATGSVVIIVIVGYATGRIWLKRNLPSWIENQLSQTLKRPVEIEEIKNLSLNRITIEGVLISATEQETDTLSIKTIDLKYNILPLLIGRPLGAQLEVTDIKGYLVEDKPGIWLDTQWNDDHNQTTTPNIPIKLDIGLDIENADIELKPEHPRKSVLINLNATGRYSKTTEQKIEYDLDTVIANGNVKIKGNTILDDGKSQIQVKTDPLNLVSILGLIPNDLLTVNTGQLEANLETIIAPRDQIQKSRGQGNINLHNLSGNLNHNLETFTADAAITLAGQNININQAQITLGELTGQLTGLVNWQQGYQLQLNINKIDPLQVIETLGIEIPLLNPAEGEKIPIVGKFNSQINVTGPLDSPQLTGNLYNTTPIAIDKISFAQIQSNFTADLNQIKIAKLEIEPTVGGKIQISGQLDTSLQQQTSPDWQTMPLLLNIKGELPLAQLISPYYETPPHLTVDNFKTLGRIEGNLGNPAGKLEWVATSNNQKIRGEGEVLLEDHIVSVYNTNLEISQGNLGINAIADLQQQTWTTQLESQNILLTPFLPANLVDKSLKLNQAEVELTGNFNLQDLKNWSGNAQVNLNLDQGNINLNSQLNSGQLNNQLQTTLINITPEITLNQSQANLSLPLEPLLQDFNVTGIIKEVQGKITASLDINNQGKVNTTTLITQGIWNSQIEANQVEIAQIKEFIPHPVNAQIQLQGELETLIQDNPSLAIAVEQLNLQTGENQLSTQGQIQLSLTDNQPEIDLVDLNLDSQVNLAEIPLDNIINLIDIPVAIKPSDINVDGQANFSGNLRGTTILTNPLDNLSVVGELQLDNFNLNQRQFESQLTGPVIINPRENLSIDLRGNRDIIAANFIPCVTEDCRLPYLPTEYQLKQGESPDAIIVSGIRQGEQLVNQISNFPLNMFSLAPGQSFGIPGVLDGVVNANLVVDLYSFATNGKITVDQPSLGYLKTELLETEFIYNPEKSEAQLVSSSFKFKNSEYNLQANVNLDTGGIEGKLDLNENDINDILETLQWSNTEDVMRFLKPPVYASADQIITNPLGNPLATIAQQVNLLWSTERQIIARNQQIRQGNAPLELDIRGKYTGEVLFGGTITQPELEFKFHGLDWQWRTRPGILTTVESLGVVWENQQIIPIQEVLLAGNFNNGVVQIKPARLEMSGAVFNLQGSLFSNQEKAEFSLENLSLDLVNEFVAIPVDVTGIININGTIAGDLASPSVQGEIALLDTTLNSQTLTPELSGEFSYASEAKFRTTFPESIQLEATIPMPTPETTEGIATLDLKLSQKIFELLSIFTQGQLTWQDGQGEFVLNAQLPLDWSQPLELIELLEALQVNGNLTLDKAVIDSPLLDKSLYLDGVVQLENQLLKTEDLKGNLGDTTISIAGVFPLVKPLSPTHRDVANPLSINIQGKQIILEGLYKGKVDGNIILTGTALSPIVGGELTLADGNVSIPEAQAEQQQRSQLAERWMGNKETEAPIKITLTDFRLKTHNIDLAEFSLYKFNFGGQLTLNGEINDLEKISANGLITLERGEIIFLDTQFFLAPRHTSTIQFKPNQGLFNPNLDIQMETAIGESPDTERQFSATEIREDLFSLRSNRIRVNIAIEGRANQLIPTLAQNPEQACQFHSDSTPPIAASIESPQRLQQLEDCIRLTNIARSGQVNGNLLNSPIVQLTSSPIRSKSELLDILAGQLLGVADDLENSSGSELLQLGVDQFVIGPLLRDSIFTVEQFISRNGERIGLDDLRVYPVLETVYTLNKNSSLRVTYDYFFNEGQIRYELGF